MTRDELLAEAAAILQDLNDAKADLAEVMRRGKRRGRSVILSGEDQAEADDLNEEIRELQADHQRALLAVSQARRERAISEGHAFREAFRQAAYEVLPQEQFAAVMARTREIQAAHPTGA